MPEAERFYPHKLGRVFGVPVYVISSWAYRELLGSTTDGFGRRCFTLDHVKAFVEAYKDLDFRGPWMDPLHWAIFSAYLKYPHAFERGCGRDTKAYWVSLSGRARYSPAKVRRALESLVTEGVFEKAANHSKCSIFRWKGSE